MCFRGTSGGVKTSENVRSEQGQDAAQLFRWMDATRLTPGRRSGPTRDATDEGIGTVAVRPIETGFGDAAAELVAGTAAGQFAIAVPSSFASGFSC